MGQPCPRGCQNETLTNPSVTSSQPWGSRQPLRPLGPSHIASSHQDFCAAPGPAPPGAQAPQSPFILAPNATHLEWARNSSLAPGSWPPTSSLQAWLAAAGRACADACLDHGLVCEPSFFPFLNSQDAFQK